MDWKTLLVSVILLGIICAIVIASIRKKKEGKHSCACGCGQCAMKDICHGTVSKK